MTADPGFPSNAFDWSLLGLVWLTAWSGWTCLLYERVARRAGLGPREWHHHSLDNPRARATTVFNLLGSAAALAWMLSPWTMALWHGVALLAAAAAVRAFGLRLRPLAMPLVLGSLMALLAFAVLVPAGRVTGTGTGTGADPDAPPAHDARRTAAAQAAADSACRTWPSPRTT